MKHKLLFLLCAALTALHVSFAQSGDAFRSPAGADPDRAIGTIREDKPDREALIEQAKNHYVASQQYNIADAGTSDKYRYHIGQSMRYFEMAGQKGNHALLFQLLGMSMYYSNMPDSTIFYLNKSLEPYPKNPGTPEGEIEKTSYLFLAEAYEAQGILDCALKYRHKLLDLSSDLRDTTMIVSAAHALGMTYLHLDKEGDAIEYFMAAGEMAEAAGDYHTAYVCYTAISSVYSNQCNGQSAMAMADSAIRNAEKLGDTNFLGVALQIKGLAYYVGEKYDEAINTYEQALKCYEETGDQERRDVINALITGVYNKMGSYDEAYKNIRSAETDQNLTFRHEEYVLPGSYNDMKIRMMTSDVNAEHEKVKFEVVNEQILIREAKNLRQSIWFISALSILIIVSLLLLYNRQRQKAKAAAAARYAQEKENEFLAFRNESEGQMMRKYIDGLESERSRISKELHDGICNELLAVEIQMKNGGGDANGQAVLLQNARENIRNVSHELMPPAFQHASIDEILSDYVAHLKAPDTISVNYAQSEGVDWKTVPQKTAFEIYRITQEAVGNSVKHSGADEIGISLTREEGAVVLEIRDNGTGFDRTERSRGAGMRIIRERANSIGGVLNIDTHSGGTIITVRFGLS